MLEKHNQGEYRQLTRVEYKIDDDDFGPTEVIAMEVVMNLQIMLDTHRSYL